MRATSPSSARPALTLAPALALSLILPACSGEPSGDAVLPPLSGGETRTIDGDVACPDCRIELREVALLGDSADPASVREDAAAYGCMVAPLDQTDFVVSGLVGGGQLAVYHGSGPRVRTIGRAGKGPGEFGRDLMVQVGPGDTIVVVDNSNRRLAMLTPAGDFIRSFPLPGRIHAFARLPDGDFLLHVRPTGAPSDRHPLFVLYSAVGHPGGGFGHSERRDPGSDQWIVAPARPDGFWTASMWQYRLHRYTPADTVAGTLVRDADWFPPDDELSEDIYTKRPPPPMLSTIRQTSRDRLWTYTLVPDSHWKPGEWRQPSPTWMRETFDTRIEVIDLAHDGIFAVGRYDEWLAPVCGSDLVYTVVETPGGDTRLRVLQPVLVEPDGRAR